MNFWTHANFLKIEKAFAVVVGSLFFFLCTSFISVSEIGCFKYGDVHAMGGYPMVGMGVRGQLGPHAIDVSANICPLNPPRSLSLFHLRGVYLLYPKSGGFYFGSGLGILQDSETMDNIRYSFESTMGYQWKKLIFLEGNVTVPKGSTQVWPGLTLGVGF